MKKDHKHIVIASPVRRMVVGCLLLLVFIGNAWAQSEVGFVIKMRMQNHYLAHVNENGAWTVKDAETVTPECIWYSDRTYNVSGTNHNYYFLDDDGNPHFLTGPLSSNGTLTVSSTMPPTYMLTNTDRDYYFYDWDWDHWPTDGAGVARGHQYTEANDEAECTACGGDWKNVGSTENPKYECWEVYWVELKQVGENNYKWELSQNQSYNITNASGRFRKVTIEKHEREVTQTLSGALAAITPFDMVYATPTHASHYLNYSVGDFTYKYKPAYIHYAFKDYNPEGGGSEVPHNHYYYNNTDNSVAPSEVTEPTTTSPQTYKWTITGDGASFLSFVDNASNPATESDLESPTLYYVTENTFGDKTAALTLTVTYDDGITQQVSTTVTVKTTCQSPAQASLVRTYDNVTVTWYPTADSYKVYLKKSSASASSWSSVWEGTATTYTFTGLDANTPYDYKVTGICGNYEKTEKAVYHFTTKDAPDALILGAVFGGGRMADVNGKTEVIILNCDSITAVYGGNDIAGIVTHADGSNIVLGVDANDANATAYNDYNASVNVRIRDVYGGGNGYYAYNGSAFVAATDPDTPASVGASSSVMAQSASGEWNVPVWTNEGSSAVNLTIPKITKTAITVTNNVVKVDSIFGGAKNAFLTATSGNASGITVDGGTAFAVFGGNNYGGKSGAGTSKQYIEVNNTTVKTAVADYNASETGRDFGIRYLFGGGNKVAALGSDILIKGGQCDTVFAGGNSASVTTAANVEVNCSLGNHTDDNTYGKTYSSAIDPDHYSSGSIGENTILGSYAWNGTGIYNVRALFGGNNKAEMNVLPTVTLTSGSVGTVYGGGNAGDMTAQIADGTGGHIATTFEPNYIGLDPLPIYYSTRVVMSDSTMLVDYLYGGCQVSNVKYSTWVQVQNGHVGHVYGGCNISGDVGSEQRFSGDNLTSEQYQAVWGGTYVEVSGGTIYQNLIAGSNGYYHCNDGYAYIEGLDYADPEHYFIGTPIPTHNETHVVVSDGTVKGNVYAGGNMACVGFIIKDESGKPFPRFVGFASVRMSGGTVEGNVFGGGNMASIYGSNEVQVSGGTINGALYGGNDQLGTVANITNRVFPSKYDKASDNYTSLASVHTYISLTEKPKINTVYGGGNGAYTYTPDIYCNIHDHPIQSNTFVDINIDGSDTNPATQARINKVFGGGNGVTVTGAITVFLNVDNPAAYDHVDTIFGGNNQGELADVLPDIILLKGRVNTVYGGCNSGPMTGSFTAEGYSNVGSRVHLRNSYPSASGPIVPTASVTGAVYGGCCMNSVTNNTLVLVEGGTHPASMFGGCDISGNVNTSQVVVTGGTVGNVYGGGNGNYDYADDHHVYKIDDPSVLVASNGNDDPAITAPACAISQVDILGGQVGATGTGNDRSVFGGGWGAATSTTGNVTVNFGANGAQNEYPKLYGNIYGGSALGSVNTDASYTTTVNVLNGTLNGDIFGGGLGEAGAENVAKGQVNGKVYVNIGAVDDSGSTPVYSGNATINGSVFGCNNTNGSPQDDVFVNIYKTAHGSSPEANLYPNNPPLPYTEWNVAALAVNAALPQGYAIEAVYGGGNLAAYTPVADKSSTVHVYSCDNTIRSVFGGGNSADVGKGVASDLTVTQRANTNVIIEGGRIHRVIGGGNGEDTSLPAANIFGTASTTVYAGLIDEVYGGANIRGSVDGINLIMSNPNQSLLSNCNDEVYGAVFGCANAAPYNKSVITTIECGVGTIGELYGGSNQNYIGSPTNHNSGAHVTLNIYGGEYINVFAGSKGVAGSPGVAADIYGDVTLNLYGGTITNAFGGSDANGNITGNITVNVLDFEETNCGLDVTNIYGASNQTAYAPDDGGTRVSPVVNVMHISQAAGVKGNVFGGGNEALVTSNPEVNIGYYATNMSSLIPTNYPTTSSFYTTPRGYVKTNVYGGGNEAGVTGDPVINIRDKGTVVTGIYGGCNTNGDVDGDINVNIYGGTLGTSSEAMTDGIFGGGKGHNTGTNGNVTVTINKETVESTAPEIYADVYGGSALGEVGATDKTAKVHLIAGTVNGNVFGGGKGEGTAASTQATVTGNTNVTIEGGTLTSKVNGYVYGGCNINGNVVGNITVDANGGTVSNDLFGGGQGSVTTTQGNVTVTIDGGTIGNDVYGGSALGQVNNETADLTKVNLKSGTVTGNLYGGGMGDAVDHTDIWGQVNGNVEVHVTGGTVNNVFGCNNYNEAPEGTVKVYINETTANTMHINGNVYGGGNEAAFSGTTEVYIQNGTINNKVFGGGNNITIANKGVGGSNVQMTGGTVLGGIFGGCNTDGDVTGNTIVTLTGGTIGATGEGNGGVVFGGGYGYLTEVKRNVTVTFGDLNADPSDSPKLIGDLYGGSALGNVNTATSDMTPYTTTVNIYNGEITGPDVNTYGNVFGGGLGDASHAALVKGKVYVNIGKTNSPPSGSLSGKATLVNCNVYGCNNVSGSPQDDVEVNVYQTAHIQGTNTVDDRDYAILQVFGGGNRANYAPENNNEDSEKKTHVYIHGCENTVRYVYGGSNAADAVGVVTLVGGGHFDEIFGGGNGAFGAANIGKGGIGLNVMGGTVSYLYAGSNKHGTNNGPSYEVAPLDGFIDCGDLVVESFFFGDNEAEHYGDIVHTITCEEAADFHYTKLYGGSRWAIVYGDIKLTVCGGIIESLFGGSMGYAINQIPAHVRRFPSKAEIDADLTAYPYPGSDTTLRKYSYNLRKFMNYSDPEHYKTDLVGKGGNIELVITGGTIGEAIGGCDELGNVEGKITVIVDDAENPDCPLHIGNIYGASDYTYYKPCDYEGDQVYYDPTSTHGNSVIPTPQVIVVKVTNATGVAYDFNGNGIIGAAETFAGNIYGGANKGAITSNPRVIIGDGTTGPTATKVTISGDVYGGGNLGNVIGSPQVVIVPTRHELTFNNTPTGGTFTVSYPRGTSVSNGGQIGEGITLRLVATPAATTSTTGYVFDRWEVTGTGASVGSTTAANTLFTMGTTDASVSAIFSEKAAHTLTIEGSGGTYTVDGDAYTSPVYVVETASVTVQVTPADGYAFDYWEVSGTGASVSSTQSTTTVFTMGTENATLTAHFKTAHLLSLVADQSTYGSFKINGVATSSIYLAENEIATVVAVPTAATEGNGYLFNSWAVTGGAGSTLSSNTSAAVTFKMGTENTTLTATFNEVSAHALTMQAIAGGTPGTGGSFKVDGANYTAPVWIAQGATVPIVATPAFGYRFKQWIDTEAYGGTIGDPNAAYTVFTMGSGDTHTVTAEFEAIATHVFTFVSDPPAGGTITVTDSDGNPVNSGDEIREGATLNIKATAAEGYHFTEWTIDDTGANAGARVGNVMYYETTFTMGTANATITANYELNEP